MYYKTNFVSEKKGSPRRILIFFRGFLFMANKKLRSYGIVLDMSSFLSFDIYDKCAQLRQVRQSTMASSYQILFGNLK